MSAKDIIIGEIFFVIRIVKIIKKTTGNIIEFEI